MKFTALVVTALVAGAANVASATDYQPALRALAAPESDAPNADTLAASPTERQSTPVEAAVAADKEHTVSIDAESKKSKEWWGGLGWGRPWGGYGGGWGGYGGRWGGYGGGWGW